MDLRLEQFYHVVVLQYIQAPLAQTVPAFLDDFNGWLRLSLGRWRLPLGPSLRVRSRKEKTLEDPGSGEGL